MIQRDYILRMIEEAAQAIAALVGLRKGGKYDQALQALGETFDTYFPFTGERLRHTEEKDLLSLILDDYKVDEKMLGPLADLLREEGEYWFSQGKYDNAKDALVRSMLLLNYMNEQETEIYSLDRMRKLGLIQERLKEM